jgi:hypothetical protein
MSKDFGEYGVGRKADGRHVWMRGAEANDKVLQLGVPVFDCAVCESYVRTTPECNQRSSVYRWNI